MERRQHNLRRKWQRSDHRPGSKCAVIWPERNPASLIIIKIYSSAVDAARCGSRPIARRKSPDMFAIALEMSWISNRVLLLRISRSAAVLEIIDRLAFHVFILNAAKVDPHMRELMNEKWSGIKML